MAKLYLSPNTIDCRTPKLFLVVGVRPRYGSGLPKLKETFSSTLRGREIITPWRRICRRFPPRIGGVALTLLTASMAAEEALFPSPLHLTRRIMDPFSEQPVIVEEFCQGNRVVSVIGPVTAIADYAAGTLTRIDRDARTFSVTSFADLARSGPAGIVKRPGVSQQPWRVSSSGRGEVGGRTAERVVIERQVGGGRHELEIATDPLVLMSRPAAEALLGFGFPAAPRAAEAELIFGALSKGGGGSRSGLQGVGLPLAQIERFSSEGEELESRNEVTRVGSEGIDPKLLEVPAGSVRVELEQLDVWRKLEEVDQPVRP